MILNAATMATAAAKMVGQVLTVTSLTAPVTAVVMVVACGLRVSHFQAASAIKVGADLAAVLWIARENQTAMARVSASCSLIILQCQNANASQKRSLERLANHAWCLGPVPIALSGTMYCRKAATLPTWPKILIPRSSLTLVASSHRLST